MQAISKASLVGLLCAGLLSGCGGSSSSSPDQGPVSQTLTIPFKAVAGTTEIACGEEIQSLGAAGTTVTVADFRFFVHDVMLITDEGVELPLVLDANQPSQNDRVAQLDFRNTFGCEEGGEENSAYNDVVVGAVSMEPAVVIDRIRFTLGVPFELNHANQANAVEPLRNPGLASGAAWSWQAGYKFTGLDVLPVGGITRPDDHEWSNTRWNIHLGSSGCDVTTAQLTEGELPEPCAAPNHVVITLPLEGLELGDNAAIQLDYAALVSGSNLSLDHGGASGCMSGQTDPECKAIFRRLGLPWDNGSEGQVPLEAVDNASVEKGVFSIVSTASDS